MTEQKLARYVEIRFFNDGDRAAGIELIFESGRIGRSGRTKENLVVHQKTLEDLDKAGIRYEVIDD